MTIVVFVIYNLLMFALFHSYVSGLEDVSKHPDLLAELHRQGWTQDELQKLIGEKFIRVFRGVEKVYLSNNSS